MARELLVGRRESRVAAGERAAIGLVLTGGVRVAARFGELFDFVGRLRKLGGDRELRAERMQLIEITLQHGLGRAAQREPQRLGIDVGIAVPVAADPAAQPQEALRPMRQQALPARIEQTAAPAGTHRADR